MEKAGHLVLGRGGNPLPSVGLLLAVVIQHLQYRSDKDNKPESISRFDVPSESTRLKPLSSLLEEFLVSLPLLDFVLQECDGVRL